MHRPETVQGYYFRIYYMKNCPYCMTTKNFFINNGIPYHEVEVDILLKSAIPKALNMEKLDLPIVVNFITGELCVGYHKDIYVSWFNIYHAIIGDRFSSTTDKGQLDNDADSSMGDGGETSVH